MHHVDATKAKPEKPAFGRWLLNQAEGGTASSAVKDLARAAKLDRGFPRDGTPDDVSAHLNRSMAEQEQHEALETAALSWQYD